MNLPRLFFIIFLLYLFPLNLQAQMYEWTDERGVKHFSNVAPSESAEGIKTEKTNKESKAADKKPGIVDKKKSRRDRKDTRRERQRSEAKPEERTAMDNGAQSAEESFFEKINIKLDRFPMNQDNLIIEEKERLKQIKNYSQQRSLSREDLIEKEKDRLLKAIEALEKAPLDKFGSYDNKRRQVGFYKYKLEELLESPDTYFGDSGD
ncbi:MAG: DUF4124 domain-containing protein [Desulfobacterales bacterium]|jgi:hypothetical protein